MKRFGGENKSAQKLKHGTEEFQSGPSRAPSYVTILEFGTRRREHMVIWNIHGARGSLSGRPCGGF